MPVTIGSTRVGFLSGTIQLKNLVIHNPAGYPEKHLLTAPEVTIDFEPARLLKGSAHFKEIRLNLSEVNVIKRKDGQINVKALKPAEESKGKKTPAPAAEKEKEGKKMGLQIDRLYLSVGKVVYKDYTGSDSQTQVFDVGIKDRVYTNIQDPSALVSLIVFEALTRTTLARLADLDLDVFKEAGLKALGGGLGALEGGESALEDTGKALLGMFN